ncbi:nucleoside-specific channel-forming Tsx family protein [Photobacterium sp. J15]|uniref:nucleoside-specific channel-forming Tsx family protein n=1 Tax=Photobacterium sp. J15 TaxID=265901 RepID=UPI0007E48689|nr:outer membrane protein OmpK [Photobacterium sp. J15]
MYRTLAALSISTALALSGASFAVDYSDDIRKNDYKWMTFNVMQSIDNKIPFGFQDDTYFEMEFGGRSGWLDVYGYLDVFDLFNSSNSDRNKPEGGGPEDFADNFFFKFAPRLSIDGMTGKDLSFGPVQELYISTVTNVGDQALFEHYIGIGSDIQVPWFGKMGLNTYARYVRENFGAENEGEWDGYMVSTNWFKPWYTLDSGHFVTYQGYLDYKFGASKISDGINRTTTAVEWFNGIYYHMPQWAFGYGLKYYHNMALFKDGGFAGDTTGFGHYLSVNYKF